MASDIIDICRIPLVLLVLSGIIGNIFCLIVLRLKYPRTSVAFLLTAICVADSVMLSSTFVGLLVYWFGRTGTLSKIILTYSMYFTSDIAQFISIWLIVVLTFARYMAVANPLHAVEYCSYGRIKVAVLMVAMAAVVIEAIRVPNLLKCKAVVNNSSNLTSSGEETNYKCKYLSGSGYIKYTEYLYFCGGMFVFPMLPIFYYCVGLIKALHQNNTIAMAGRSVNVRQEADDITRAVIAIVIVFFLSYSMYLVWMLSYEIVAFDNFMKTNAYYGQIFEAGMNFAFNLNSSLNFVIYLICTRSFRKRFRELFQANRQQYPSQDGPTHTVL